MRMKTVPETGSRATWNEQSEAIITLFLKETGQTPGNAEISNRMLLTHFGERLSAGQYEMIRTFLASRGRLARQGDNRSGWKLRYRIIPTKARTQKDGQVYRVERRLPYQSRRGEQGS